MASERVVRKTRAKEGNSLKSLSSGSSAGSEVGMGAKAGNGSCASIEDVASELHLIAYVVGA